MKVKMSCKKCGKFFEGDGRQVYCAKTCQKSRRLFREKLPCSPGTAGAAIELFVVSRFMLDGWAVFVPAGPNGAVDIIAMRGGVTRFLEVRTGYRGENGLLTYSTIVHEGTPQPTEFAVVVVSDMSLHFVSIPDQTEKRKIKQRQIHNRRHSH